MPAHAAIAQATADEETKPAHNSPHEALQQWYEVCLTVLPSILTRRHWLTACKSMGWKSASTNHNNGQSIGSSRGRLASTARVHPVIEELEIRARTNLKRHLPHNYTLDTALRLAALCRNQGLRLAECGAFQAAFVLLTETHTLLSRRIPKHTSHKKKLTEKERQHLSLVRLTILVIVMLVEITILSGICSTPKLSLGIFRN